MSANPQQKKTALLIAVLGIAGLVAMGYFVDARLRKADADAGNLSRLGSFGLESDLSKLTAGKGTVTTGNKEALPVLAQSMPDFEGISKWLNSDELTPEKLKGKVVLIDFWTYSCINCIRTLPYVTSWYGKYKDKGFVVVGVHTPEFAFEKVESNVQDALKRHAIAYPVALDNDYGTWNAYGNRYWPAHYLFDAQGRLRETHFGEGAYDETELAIQSLLAEAGKNADMPVTEIDTKADLKKVGSPETYIGYGRQEFFSSPERVAKDDAQAYSVPSEMRQNMFALDGSWKIEEERAVLVGANGSIVHRFNASNVNLVMGSEKGTVRAEVTLDGKPVPDGMRGNDLVAEDGKTYVDVSTQRLYSLIDAQGQYGTHVLRVQFLQSGADCYAFTFG